MRKISKRKRNGLGSTYEGTSANELIKYIEDSINAVDIMPKSELCSDRARAKLDSARMGMAGLAARSNLTKSQKSRLLAYRKEVPELVRSWKKRCLR